MKITQDNPKETWKLVPLQDFRDILDQNEHSEKLYCKTGERIDWEKSIPEIDQQLYKKYGLDQDEINFIENKIKEME